MALEALGSLGSAGPTQRSGRRQCTFRTNLHEIWVVATKTITHGAKEKIFHKYSTTKIEFIDGAALQKLVDDYMPLAWSRLPIAVREYLHNLRTRTDEQDKSVSLLISDEAFYVTQDLYRVRDIEYRYKAQNRLRPEKIVIDRLAESYRRILVEGGVGSGKSKLLRRLIAQATVPERFSETKVLPVAASYTELMEDHSGNLMDLINHRVPDAVRKLCGDSEYLVLIDAFDERRTETNSETDDLNALLDQASDECRIRLVVTSRFLKGQRGGVLRPDVARCELQPLSLQRTFEFIIKLCRKVNVKNRILEDLKRSPLFRNLPKSPMSAILLARLLNENQQEVPSNIAELYSKYSELILGRWDEKKGLQSQKEYQALDAILMRLSRQMIEDQRAFISVLEVKASCIPLFFFVSNIKLHRRPLDTPAVPGASLRTSPSTDESGHRANWEDGDTASTPAETTNASAASRCSRGRLIYQPGSTLTKFGTFPENRTTSVSRSLTGSSTVPFHRGGRCFVRLPVSRSLTGSSTVPVHRKGGSRQRMSGPSTMSHPAMWTCPACGRPLTVALNPEEGEAGAHRPLEISRASAAAHACAPAARFPQFHNASSLSIIGYEPASCQPWQPPVSAGAGAEDDEGVISQSEYTLTKPSSCPNHRDHVSTRN